MALQHQRRYLQRMEIREKINIAAPASEAWRIIGEEFGDIGQWASPISTSSISSDPSVGAVRTCHIGGFGPIAAGMIKEKLIAFQPERMQFQYDAVEGLPSFIAHATNHWSIETVDANTCTVQTHATLKLSGIYALLGPILKIKMAHDGYAVLEELKFHIENGQPHPRKRAAITKQVARQI